MKFFIAVLLVLLGPLGAQDMPASAEKPQVLIVGAYHFVSKANVFNMPVDDPLSPRRQAQITDLVEHLARFHPTKIVLEQTSGTRDLEKHYAEYLNGTFALPASENFQVGFRLASQLKHPAIFEIDAHTDFDYPALLAYAEKNGQTGLIDKASALTNGMIATMASIQDKGTVLDLYRYLNSEDAIRLNNESYMYLARIGDSDNFVGASLVASWHLRNLEMFAKLTRLVESPRERILVLYGQGHQYLLQDFVGQSPDLSLVSPRTYLK